MSNHIRDGGRGGRAALVGKGLWLRIYTSVLKPTDKTREVDDRAFRRWIYTLCAYKDNGGVMPTIKALSRCFGCTEQQAQVALDELVRAGLLDQSADGGITPHDWDEMQFESDSSTERTRKFREKKRHISPSQERSAERFGNVPGNALGTASEYRVHSTEEIPIVPFAAEAEFERIWNAYPPKGRTRRIQCEQIFSTLIGRANGNAAQLVEEILAPLAEGGKWTNSRQWGKNEGQFIFGLADYLTQQRWREEPEQKGEWD